MAGVDPQFLQHLVGLLQSAASGAGAHKGALDELNNLKQTPDFFRYCAALLVATDYEVHVRQLAGLQIKNGVRNPNCNSVLEVRQSTMQALADQSNLVRSVACSIISTALSHSMWDPRATVNEILVGLASGEEMAMRGCLKAISEVVDENIELLDFNSADAPAMTPKIAEAVLPLLAHGDEGIQLNALKTVSVIMEQAAMRREGATYDYMGTQVGAMLQFVGGILSNPQAKVKFLTVAAQCMYYTLAYAEAVSQHVNSMVNLMTGLSQHPDEEVRIEVVQFFKVVLEAQLLPHIDPAVVPNVLRYILDCLVYSDMELGMLQESQGNANVPDKPEDVRPKNFQLKAKRAGDDSDDEGDEDDVDQWNLRKAAGGCLLGYVNNLGDQILEYILNDVAARLGDANWQTQESAILALGIMAGGCEGLNAYLESILDRLLGMLVTEETHFLVKGMCLWTLEQNAEFVITDDRAKAANFLPRTMEAVLAHMTSSTKILQQRGISALDSYAEASEDEELVPYLGQILTTMGQCFSGYQLKNLYLLFETADTVYTCFGRRLAEDDAIQAMMAPLMSMWSSIANDSPLIFPFFMAMSSACSALGAAIEPMAQGIFTRSFAMVEYHVGQRLAAIQANEDAPDYSQEFLVAGLDLLSGVCEAMGSSIELYITEIGAEKMNQLITTTASDTAAEVRQSALSVLGELMSASIGFVQAMWGTFAPLIANCLEDTQNYTVASNAAWALSDFLGNTTEGANIVPPQQVDGFYARLANLLALEYDSDMRVMRENAAIGIGRLIAFDPAVTGRVNVAPFFGAFCSIMAPMANGANKEAAIRGLVGQWAPNPALLANDVGPFLDLLAGLPQNISQDLRAELRTLAQALKQGVGAQMWDGFCGKMSNALRQKVQRGFGV